MTGFAIHRRTSAPAIFQVSMPRRLRGSTEQIAPVDGEMCALRMAVKAASSALREGSIDVAKARLHLEHAEDVLQSMGRSPLANSERDGLDRIERNRHGAKACPDFGTCEGADTAKWLVDTFTEENSELSYAPCEMQMSKTNSLRVRRPPQLRERSVRVHRTLELPAAAAVLEKAGGIEFNALDLAAVLASTQERPIPIFGAHVLQYQGDLINCIQERGWIRSKDTFLHAFIAFLSQVDALYLPDVRYHNASHAVDVMATTDMLMRADYVTQRSTSLDHVMALAAAAIHDVGHPGKNALFQTKTMSPLALRYNDKSILENMHASLAFSTMQQEAECNWLTLLAKESSHQMPNLQQYARQGIISMVLATDMAKHQKYVVKLASFLENAGPVRQENVQDKFLMLDTMLHAADLSNPGKPREIAMAWTRRVCEEFWSQGDEERRLGLAVSPLCDRETGIGSVPQSQIGFINFVVKPLYNPLAMLVPEVKQINEEMDKNVAFWEEKMAEGASFVQLFGEEPSM